VTHDMYVFSADGVPAWVASEDGSLLGASGPAVLAGLVMRVLLTEHGSIPTARGEGTHLPSLVNSSVDQGQVVSVAVASLQHATQYIKNLQSRYAYPKNESLKALTLQSAELENGDTLRLRILIENQAGAVFSTTALLGG